MATTMDADEIRQVVRKAYAKLADNAGSSCCGPLEQATSTACSSAKGGEAVEIDSKRRQRLLRIYSSEELASLPDSVVEAAAGCGNPGALANLRAGEVIVDLGSGGGIDCFLASQKVGPTGRIIGVDMTPEMIALARANAKKVGATNVEFRLGELEHLPVQDSIADAIISNCVINLSPDKDAVFAEAFRVLKPGGRLAVSDIVFEAEPSEQLRRDFAAWAGCVGGALVEGDYLAKIRATGFADVAVESRSSITVGEHTISSVKVVSRRP